MTTVVWTDVSAVSSTWGNGNGYVLVDYVVDDYVQGDEGSGGWVDASAGSTVWTSVP